MLLAEVLGFRGEELLTSICALVAIISLAVFKTTKMLSDNSRKSQRDDMEATLKMEMIQRGLSAEEIERVLAARMDPVGREGCSPRRRREEATSR